MKRMLVWSALLVLVLVAAAALFGPRVAADTTIRFDPAAIGGDPEAYLAAAEARFDDIRPGLAKEIVWADPADPSRRPVAIVYIHGFSASKGELRPVPDLVASALGANLFYTRLAGHGRDSAAMAEATVNDWVNDLAEALAVGRAIGERVVVMATSTGAGLATWSASRPELTEDVAAFIFVSPNYGVRASGAWLLTAPWGAQLADMLLDPEIGFTPTSPLQREWWTSRYPARAVLPMAALVQLARRTPVEQATVPALFVFSDGDRVVDQSLTRQILARWGAPAETIVVEETEDPNRHVLAGDAYSPSTTEPMARQMVDWLRPILD